MEAASYLRGKHSFKFGLDYVDIIFDGSLLGSGPRPARFQHPGEFPPGQRDIWNDCRGQSYNTYPGVWWAPFVQDDWRLRPRVTLNLGFRYEYIGSPWERSNYIGGFNPNVNPATTSALQQVGPGEPLPLIKSDKREFMPRLGGAWDIKGNGKTVVRAAGGILMNPPPMTPFVPSNPFGANFPSIGVNNERHGDQRAKPRWPRAHRAQIHRL